MLMLFFPSLLFPRSALAFPNVAVRVAFLKTLLSFKHFEQNNFTCLLKFWFHAFFYLCLINTVCVCVCVCVCVRERKHIWILYSDVKLISLDNMLTV